MLVLAIIIASFPVMIGLGVGTMTVITGVAISDTANDYSWGSDDDFGDAVGDFGSATAGIGIAILGFSGLLLASVIATGVGSNVGRILMTIWMSIAVVLLFAGTITSGGQMGGPGIAMALVMIGVPVLGIIGMYTPRSNEVFRPVPYGWTTHGPY